MRSVIVPIALTLLAMLAGVLHLADNYLPMEIPADANGGPPAALGRTVLPTD